MRLVTLLPPLVLCILACGGLADVDSPSTPVVAPEAVPAPTPAAPTSRCGSGLQQVDYWQGEYPGPVVEVTSAVEVPSYNAPCDGAPSATCRLEPGLYHPWPPGAGKAFATLRPIDRFRATRAGEIGDGETTLSFAEGTTVEVLGYYGEGYCALRVEGKSIDGMCPGMSDDGLEEIPGPETPEIQLFQAPCGTWVQVDESLFARPEVRQGDIVEYGKVGHQGEGFTP